MSGEADDSAAGAGAPVPRARARRRSWPRLPTPLRHAVEARLGAPVIAARSESGGFSVGAAVRLRCANHRRAFFKAVQLDRDPYAVALYRREAEVAAHLPRHLPVARFLGQLEASGWLGLVFEEVPGDPVPLPWRSDHFAAVSAAVDELAELTTPCPVSSLMQWGGPAGSWPGWSALGAAGVRAAPLPSWCKRRYPSLVRLEADLAAAVAGDTLLHSDLRSDNILLSPAGVRFVDWAWAARGQPWVDRLIFCLLAAVQRASRCRPERLHPDERGQEPPRRSH